MKRSQISAIAIVFALSSLTVTVSADDGHDHSGHQHGTAAQVQHGPHGGELAYAAATWHEVVFRPDGVRIFLYDAKGQPVDAARIAGQITLKVDGNPKPYTYALRPDTARGAETNALTLALDLSKIPDGRMQTEFSISGIPGQSQPAQFAQRFHVTRTADELAIAQQKICPVSGKALGSMGAPPKVRIGERDVFVCCAGCTSRLKADPETYLAKLPPAGPVKATREDAAAIAFQKTCPVMQKPLDAMGGPWKINLRGRDVFVCCPGCTKALEREPAKYLALLPTPPATKATQADATAVAAQKLCPVMNESLMEMGGPWKVYAKGQPIFVCCKGCIAKVEQNPDFYLAKATRQASATQANSRR